METFEFEHNGKKLRAFVKPDGVHIESGLLHHGKPVMTIHLEQEASLFNAFIAAISARDQRIAELEKDAEAKNAILTVGNGLNVYGSLEAILRAQDYILLDSKHPQEAIDVRRSLARALQETEAALATTQAELEQEREAIEIFRKQLSKWVVTSHYPYQVLGEAGESIKGSRLWYKLRLEETQAALDAKEAECEQLNKSLSLEEDRADGWKSNSLRHEAERDTALAEAERLRGELVEVKRRQIVREPFEWLRSWLQAYSDRSGNLLDVEEVMQWIMKQPMTRG